MTTYDPQPSVTFNNSTSYPDAVLADINITLGRRDIMEQPQAGYCSFSMYTDADTPLNVALSQSVQIYVKDTLGANQQLFGGTVSDIEIEMPAYGTVGSYVVYTITAVGALAQLNKRTAGAVGFNKETDGVRILNILTEAFLTSWNEVSPTLTWQNVPATTTWANYDGTSLSLVNNLATYIDQPTLTDPQYELMAYSSGTANALDLAQDAAQSGRGVLFESEDGDIHYDDFVARSTNPVITLTADDISADGLRTAAQWSEIVNDAAVTYRAGTEVARDEQSIILYGQLSGSRDTQLHNASDALAQAQAFVETRAYPRMYPEVITCPLHSPTMTNATRNALLDVIVGTGIATSDLPAVFGTTFNGFVEGINWRITRHTIDLALTLSAESENYPHQIWYQVPPTVTWAGYNPTTKWEDL